MNALTMKWLERHREGLVAQTRQGQAKDLFKFERYVQTSNMTKLQDRTVKGGALPPLNRLPVLPKDRRQLRW